MSIHKKLIENLPKRIAKEILLEFSEPNANATKRWIWELLQNAKDCAFDYGVDIKINLNNDFIEFSHNGMPFTEDDIIGLLTKDSSKTPTFSDDDKYKFFNQIIQNDEISGNEIKKFLSKTGKFGTGFMTTYLLSKTIHLETTYQLDNDKYAILEIDLDRNADSLPMMEDKVHTSFKVFDKIDSLTENDFIEFDSQKNFTTFKYIFTSEVARRNANIGIENLQSSIYYTLAFVDTINSLELSYFGDVTKYEKQSKKNEQGINNVVIAENGVLKNFVVVASKYNAYQIAIPIEISEEDNTTTILHIEDNLPTQYISFPLISEHIFNFPVVVNSPLFNPNEPRDALFIGSDEDFDGNEMTIKKAKLNKEIYEKTIDLYLSLLSHASENNWKNIHYLAKTNTPKIVDKKWFKDIQSKIRVRILNAEIVQPASGNNKIKPKDAFFPYYEDSDKFQVFWSLCHPFIGDKMPVLEQAEVWQKIIHPNKTEYKTWETDFCFNIENLVSLIQGELKTLQSTADRFFSGNLVDAIKNVKNVIQFIENEKLDILSRKESPYCILPNLEGNYIPKEELYKNENIPLELIECVRNFGDDYDYSKIIIYVDFNDVFISDSKKNVLKLSNTAKLAIEKFIKDNKPDTNNSFLSAVLKLVNYSDSVNLQVQQDLHDISLKFYPISEAYFRQEKINILNVPNFDWSIANHWLINKILSEFQGENGIKNLDKLALSLFKRNYEVDNDDEVDTFINSFISFVEKHYNDLLNKFAIIPNQNNVFCLFNGSIYNDVDDKAAFKVARDKKNYEWHIPKDLKQILIAFGDEYDFKHILRHNGINILLAEQRDIEDICKKLDEVVMNLRDSEDNNIKQAIRDLDNWISRKDVKSDEHEKNKLKKYFGRFFDVRAGIAYNTLSIEEKQQSGKIIHSGFLSELSKIAQVVEKHDDKGKQDIINSVLNSLKKESERIEQEKFYRNLGKTVEDIFSSLTGSNAQVFDNGQDFLLIDSLLQIGIRLEIKSRSRKGNFVLMTKKQVETAVTCKESYVLCVFPDVQNSTPQNFKIQAKFILDIKTLLEDRFNQTENFVYENILDDDSKNIQLEFENMSYKYKVNRLVWERTNDKNVLDFTQFEEFIRPQINQ